MAQTKFWVDENLRRRKMAQTKICVDEKWHRRNSAWTKICVDERMHRRKIVQAKKCETKIRKCEKLRDEKVREEKILTRKTADEKQQTKNCQTKKCQTKNGHGIVREIGCGWQYPVERHQFDIFRAEDPSPVGCPRMCTFSEFRNAPPLFICYRWC